MSCTSCNGHPLHNCDCTTYQLPVGPTGAAGATGATGPAGPAGTNIITNVVVGQSTTTSGSYETLYTYTLSNPSPISAVGDILIIRSFWSNDGTAPAFGSARTVKVLLDNTNIVVYGITPTPNLGNGIFAAIYDIALTRVSATTVAPEVLIKRYGGFGILGQSQNLHSPNINSAGLLTIPSLDSGDIDVKFQASSVVTGDITLDKIEILKITQ